MAFTTVGKKTPLKKEEFNDSLKIIT